MGMSYLLDTHALLWLIGEPTKLPALLVGDLANRDNDLWVSAASAMEVATKVRLGKLDTASHLVDSAVWKTRVVQLGANALPLTVEHCLYAGSMAWDHRDPFDRFLAAQAIIENLVLVTKDREFSALAQLSTRW
jgi:PIN domain nuclease of toxin-antitoxin system